MPKTLVIEAEWISRHEVTVEDDWDAGNDDHNTSLYDEVELQIDTEYRDFLFVGWSIKEKS